MQKSSLTETSETETTQPKHFKNKNSLTENVNIYFDWLLECLCLPDFRCISFEGGDSVAEVSGWEVKYFNSEDEKT